MIPFWFRQSRELMLSVTVATAALMATVWSYYSFTDSRASMSSQQEASRDAAALFGKIERLKARTAGRSAAATQPTDMGTFLEQVAAKAAVASANIVRITPQPPRELGQTGLQSRICQADLRGLKLGQVLTVLDHIEKTGQGIEIRELRVSATSRETTEDNWNVELQLGQIVQTSAVSLKTLKEKR